MPLDFKTYAPRIDWRERLLREESEPKATPRQLAVDLQRARDVLVVHGWVANFMAEDTDGDLCSATHKNAARFCAVGAIHRAILGIRTNVLDYRVHPHVLKVSEAKRIGCAIEHLLRHTGGRRISDYNDTLGRDAVMTLYDDAITDARERAAR